MYLRHTIRKKDGEVHRYWRLVRSVRVGRRVIQQTVAQLGELDERGRVEARALARRLIGAPEQAQLFKDGGAANRTIAAASDRVVAPRQKCSRRSHTLGETLRLLLGGPCAASPSSSKYFQPAHRLRLSAKAQCQTRVQPARFSGSEIRRSQLGGEGGL